MWNFEEVSKSWICKLLRGELWKLGSQLLTGTIQSLIIGTISSCEFSRPSI